MEKEQMVASLKEALQAVADRRKAAQSDPSSLRARLALRKFQSERMAATHADLLAAPDSSAAARFFLDELYGTHDLTRRDENVERVVPMMERLLPGAALQTIMEAVQLDALSEALDERMAARLGETFTDAEYAQAYREVGTRAERERQLVYVESLGAALCRLVQVPLIGRTLSLMRGPAKLTGLSELHRFLERGFGAFAAMKRPETFVSTVMERETRILERLYAGSERPFEPG